MEAQHIVSTIQVVDTPDKQFLPVDILEEMARSESIEIILYNSVRTPEQKKCCNHDL